MVINPKRTSLIQSSQLSSGHKQLINWIQNFLQADPTHYTQKLDHHLHIPPLIIFVLAYQSWKHESPLRFFFLLIANGSQSHLISAPASLQFITSYIPYISHFLSLIVVVVQLLRHVWLFATPWMCQNARLCRRLSSTLSQSLLKFMSIESVMLSNYLIFCRPLLLLPLIFPSIRVFSNELGLHIKWSKYWRFKISPFNEYSELTSFSIDWFDFLAVKGLSRVAYPKVSAVNYFMYIFST